MTTWSKEHFAKNLQRYMDENGKTQRDIAEVVGVAIPTVSEWLSCKKYPRIDKIEIIANYFGIMKSDLIGESNSTNLFTPKEIGELLKEARTKKGLSRKDLAEQVEITEGSITNWENGDNQHMAPVKIRQIARILDLNPLELLGFKNLGNRPKRIVVSENELLKEDFEQLEQYVQFLKSRKRNAAKK